MKRFFPDFYLLLCVYTVYFMLCGCGVPEKQNTTLYRTHIPEDKWVVGSTYIDGKPHVGLLNPVIMDLTPKSAFSWYLSVILEYDVTPAKDLPDDPTPVMQEFADDIYDHIVINPDDPNVLYMGRVTGNGITQVMWYVKNPEPVNRYLQSLIMSGDYPIHFQYQMSEDKEWTQAHYWLDPIAEQLTR